MKSIADIAILVIEDQPMQRDFVVDLLRAMGAKTIHQAADGLSAIEVLKSDAVDLILCDIDMPRMDGAQFVVEARRCFAGKNASLPILAWVSAMDRKVLTSHQRIAQSAGFALVKTMSKPLAAMGLRILLEMTITVVNRRVGNKPNTRRQEKRNTPEELSDQEILDGVCDAHTFEVRYAPRICLTTRAIVGADAIACWNRHGVRCMMSEELFRKVEEKGLSFVLFHRTLSHVLNVQKVLAESGCAIPICVKTSASILESREISDNLSDQMQCHAIAPGQLALGLHGMMLPVDPLQLAVSLNRLRIKGFGLSMTDFGTSAFSLKLIAELPFTDVRIGAYFVRRILRHASSRAMIEAIVQVAKILGLRVVAEGVENAQQTASLRDIGCDEVQGAISSPLKTEDFLREILNARRQDAKGTPE